MDREKSTRKNPRSETRGKNTSTDGQRRSSRSTFGIAIEDPFRILLDNLEDEQEEILRQLSGLVRKPDLTQLTQTLANSISDMVEIQKMQTELEYKQKELTWM